MGGELRRPRSAPRPAPGSRGARAAGASDGRPARARSPRRTRPGRTRRRSGAHPAAASSRTGGPPARRRRRASRAGRARSAGIAPHRRTPRRRSGAVRFWPTRVTSIAISYAIRPMSASAVGEHRQAGALAGGGDEQERRLHLDDGLAHRRRPGSAGWRPGPGSGSRPPSPTGARRPPGSGRSTRPSAARRRRAPRPAGPTAPARPGRRAARSRFALCFVVCATMRPLSGLVVVARRRRSARHGVGRLGR